MEGGSAAGQRDDHGAWARAVHRPGPPRRGVWIPATHDIAPIPSLPRPPARPAGPRAPAASSRGTDCSLVRAERAVASAIIRVTGCAAGEPRVQVLRELHATPLRRQAQAERGGKAAAPRPQHRNRGGKSTAAPRERGAIETDGGRGALALSRCRCLSWRRHRCRTKSTLLRIAASREGHWQSPSGNGEAASEVTDGQLPRDPADPRLCTTVGGSREVQVREQ